MADMRDNIRLAQQFIQGFDQAAFAEDRKTVYAVTRCLEIISEASRRIPPEVKARHSDQPWERIAGAGNIYRHNYDNVAEAFVWRTVTISLPSLLAVLEAELDDL